VTKLELKYLKSGLLFVQNKKNIITDKKFFSSLEFNFFRVQFKFAFEIRPLFIFSTIVKCTVWTTHFSRRQNKYIFKYNFEREVVLLYHKIATESSHNAESIF